MGDLVLKGATSGQITLTPTAVAGTNTLTVPAETGTVITSATSTRIIQPSAVPAGSVVQVIYSVVTAYTTGTTIIPWDDTIPQNTEGTEFITASITPKSATNKLLIQFSGPCSTSAAAWIGAAMFQDATAGALSATSVYMATGAGAAQINLNYQMTAGTTSSTTFKIRVGPAVAATVAINGASTVGRVYGGVWPTTLTITEIAV